MKAWCYQGFGTPLFLSGDPVSVNQLLVEGIVTVTDDSGVVVKETYVDSDADILVRTVIPYDDHIDVEYESSFERINSY